MVVLFWFCTHTDRCIGSLHHITISKLHQCQALLPLLLFNTSVQLNTQRPLIFLFLEKKSSEEPIAFIAPYLKVMKMGMMITCANVQNH